MCVAISQGAGAKTLTMEQLENGWDTNPDGGGFAFINYNGEVEDYHSMDKDDFILNYLEKHEEYGAYSPFVVHMRIATHGKVQLSTTHPFPVPTSDGATVLAHNGIINAVDSDTNDEVSDTMAFIEQVLAHLPDNWMDNDYLVDMVAEFIGHSKLVILTTSESAEYSMYIINDQMGQWDEDTWFSNNSCDYPVAGGWYTMSDKDWDEWVKDDQKIERGWAWDTPNTLYAAEAMRNATAEDWYDMMNAATEAGLGCYNCLGIDGCYCDDMCGECYEVYHECDCSGKFKSLSSYVSDSKEVEVK